MKENIYRGLNVKYEAGEKFFWTGRKSNPNLGIQYWHQAIELVDIHDITDEKGIDIALVGYVCDEGVRRNLGRVGAALGPKALRNRLAKLPVHFDEKRIVDIGDVVCVKEEMEACQEALSTTITNLIAQDIFPIAIGGGHDMSYGHFKGIHNAINRNNNKKIGIINFDAHFDLRPVENKTNSGTPFNQILNEFENTNYFAIGIQQQSNTKELFDIAKVKGVDYVFNHDCESSNEDIKKMQQQLLCFIEQNDYLYVTIDMDGFSSAYAPGVSAPSLLGFTPNFVFKMLRILLDTKKVISCDIAELNPAFDRDNQTANLAARLIGFIVMNVK